MIARFLLAALLVGATSFATARAWLVQTPAAAGGSATAWTSAAGANNASTTVSTTTTAGDTVTSNSSTLQLGNRATSTYTSPTKVFVLFKVLAQTGGFMYVGYCNSSTALNSSGVFCGSSDANGVALQLQNGVLRNNNGANAHQFNGGTTISAGYWIEMAYYIGGSLIWVRTSNNSGVSWGAPGVCTGGPCWNDSNSGQDPNTGTGGLSITATGPFMLYYADNSNTVDEMQLDCSSAQYISDKPTGYTTC